jgi:hypothetical protein
MITRGKGKNAYTTFFDSGYLSRGLTMIESVRSFDKESPIIVLALDQATRDFFDTARLPGVSTVSVEELEASQSKLLSVKASRSRMEYYFTSTPYLFKFLFEKLKQPGLCLTYLDADLYFFSTPLQIAKALGSMSVGITPHRFHQDLERALAPYGDFNAGFVSFRDTPEGNTVLDWWAARTLEWCFDVPSQGRYANQGYLNSFPDFPGVMIFPSPGMNLAPWNIKGSLLEKRNNENFVDGSPLVFFHFHGFKRFGSRFVTGELVYRTRLKAAFKSAIYRPYAEHLQSNELRVKKALGLATQVSARGHGIKGKLWSAFKVASNLASVLLGNSVRVPPVLE